MKRMKNCIGRCSNAPAPLLSVMAGLQQLEIHCLSELEEQMKPESRAAVSQKKKTAAKESEK